MKKLLTLFTCAALSTSVYANDLELAVGDEAFFLNLNTKATSIFQGGVFNFEGLFGEEDNRLIAAGLMVRDEGQGMRPITFTLGGKLYNVAANGIDSNHSALSIGGSARFHFRTAFPLSLGVSAFYAPGTTTFSDEMTRFYDTRVDISAHILPQGFVFLGYRNTSADFEVNNSESAVDIDDSVHLGLRLLF